MIWQLLGIWFAYSALTCLLAMLSSGKVQIGRGRFWNAVVADSTSERTVYSFFALWTAFNIALACLCFWLGQDQ